ncbi:MAG: Gfo/Idh/MocA family oxidoreductase, partial [Bacteroidota bacterium]
MCRFAASLGVDMICQKPLTPFYPVSEQLVRELEGKARLIVHENFRFQPWHRQIKTLLSQGTIGHLHQLYFHSRMGDGWGPDAYLARQPYFREYERLLIYETGVHFIDVFRYHAGEVESAYALLKRLNPVIKGEDSGLMILEMRDGATAIWDANRYNESNHPKKRFTFGTYTIEGEKGTIRLYSDGRITVQLLGEPEQDHTYELTDRGFAGDCCFHFQKHAVHALATGTQAETEGIVYLNNLRVQEAVYESAAKKTRVKL